MSIGVEDARVDVVPDREGLHYLATIGIDDREHVIAAADEEPPLLEVHRQRRGSDARR